MGDRIGALSNVAGTMVNEVQDTMRPIMYGLPDGGEYTADLPTGKCSWKAFKASIDNSLDKREICVDIGGKVETGYEWRSGKLLPKPSG